MSVEMAIGDVMTILPLSIDPKEKISTAQQIMNDNNIRHLPVVEDDHPISILSERDINLAISVMRDPDAVGELKVEEVSAPKLYKVEKGTPLSEVVTYMAENLIGSVVITNHGKLDGIFTATDACKYLAICLQGQFH